MGCLDAEGRPGAARGVVPALAGSGPPPLLLLAALLALASGAWAFALACRAQPWLLLLAASWACFVLHCGVALAKGGLVGLVPGSAAAAELLRLPTFDLMHQAADLVKRYGSKWVRLILLTCVELDTKQRAEILAELDSEFRELVFQRPALEMLPGWARQLLLGPSPSKAPAAAPAAPVAPCSRPPMPRLSLSGEPALAAAKSCGSTGASSPPASHSGTPNGSPRLSGRGGNAALGRVEAEVAAQAESPAEQLAGLVRSSPASPAAGGSALQRVINEKVADVTVKAIWHGTNYQVTSTLPGVCQRVLEFLHSLRLVAAVARGPLQGAWLTGWLVVASVFRGMAPTSLQEQLFQQLCKDFRGLQPAPEAAAGAPQRQAPELGPAGGAAGAGAGVPQTAARRRILWRAAEA